MRSPLIFFFSSRRRHTRSLRDWSSDVCSSDLVAAAKERVPQELHAAPAGATEELLARLTQHLRDELDVPPEDARWAVEAWAMAVNLLPRLPPEETPPTPAGDPAIEQPACF